MLGALSPTRTWAAVVALLALGAGIFAYCRPKWEELPVDADQRCVIQMDGMENPMVCGWPGTLKIPLIVGYDVYLISNATLIASGTLPTNEFTRTLLKRDYPTHSDGHSLLLQTYHVEPGSCVIFTETTDHPKDLIKPFPPRR